MVVAYENQLIEFSRGEPTTGRHSEEPNRGPLPQADHMGVSPHDRPFGGRECLLEALTTDPDLKKIAWERHGFRVGLMSNNVSLPPSLKEIGIAPAIQSVQEMPTTVVMEQVLQAVSGR